MANGRITKEKLIPSLLINKDFIKKLAVIVEAPIRDRENEASAKAQEEISKRSEEILSKKYYTDEEKQERIRGIEEQVRRMSRPHISSWYKIKTKDNQTLTFSSIEDILSTELLPQKVDAFSIDINHYDRDNVDISIDLAREPFNFLGVFAENHVRLSSMNEAKLLQIGGDLDKLFDLYHSGYHTFTYYKNYSPLFVIVALAVTALFFNFAQNNGLYSTQGNEPLIYIFLTWCIFLYTISILRYTYPFHEFELTQKDNFNKVLRFLIGLIAATAVTNGVYDLIKYLII